MLEADIKQGISSHEVEQRRKRYGWNEITTEKENLFIKFLGFFTGPVLYGKFLTLISGIASGRIISPSLNGVVASSFVLLLQALSETRSYDQAMHPASLAETTVQFPRTWR